MSVFEISLRPTVSEASEREMEGGDLISFRVKSPGGEEHTSLHEQTRCGAIVNRPHMPTLDIAWITIPRGVS
jgi:hypothetical protein